MRSSCSSSRGIGICIITTIAALKCATGIKIKQNQIFFPNEFATNQPNYISVSNEFDKNQPNDIDTFTNVPDNYYFPYNDEALEGDRGFPKNCMGSQDGQERQHE